MITGFNKKIKVGAVIFLLGAAVLVFVDFKMYQKKQLLIAQVDSYERQIEQIKKKNELLKESIERSDDKEYIEKVAREELDMQKEGERVVSFVMPEQEAGQEPEREGFWSADFWFGWLAHLSNWIKSQF